ncbi:MAG: excinuclease ABC subunit UvrC [Pseudomonadota bacterium]|nr:excinuclease ABC subunit UvrC [Pseudomonadota bacterium]
MNKNNSYNYKIGINELKKASKLFPNGSGVYKFIGYQNEPLYVGKAKNLKKRISSYLDENRQTRRIKTLISLTHSLNFIKTPNETDSLILENNLIKQLKPKFNIRLMDDKSFPYITISTGSSWPRIRKYRGKQNKNDVYFGPFANVNVVDQVLHQLERAFLLRSCSDNFFNSRKRPCILYQIKRCSAPCTSQIDQYQYLDLVTQAINFLKGKNKSIKQELVRLMHIESEKENFETAASIRDRIKAISKISFEKYSDLNSNEDFDIIFYYKKYQQTFVQVFFFRGGKNLGNKDFFLSDSNMDKESTVISQFLIFFYKNNNPPKEILINFDLDQSEIISSIISKKTNYLVDIRNPKKGKKLELLNMVKENIKSNLLNQSMGDQNTLKLIKKKLNLLNFPYKIEVYDNSHLNGTNPVGSMIVYQNLNFAKNHYKKFNIKNKSGRMNDDYYMMNQVLERRFDFTSEWKKDLPNLIIIDGGKGQLNVALKILKKKKIKNIDVISIAKGKNRNKDTEKVYLENEEINFKENDKELFLLQRLRDEAHRFAVASQKVRRNMSYKNSLFDNIDGIGKKLKINLLSFFGSIDNIKSASLSDLKKTPGVGENMAKKIYREFNKIV